MNKWLPCDHGPNPISLHPLFVFPTIVITPPPKRPKLPSGKHTQQTPGPWLRPIKTQENRGWGGALEGLWGNRGNGGFTPFLQPWPWPPASNSHSLITEICVPSKAIVGESIVWGPREQSAFIPERPLFTEVEQPLQEICFWGNNMFEGPVWDTVWQRQSVEQSPTTVCVSVDFYDPRSWRWLLKINEWKNQPIRDVSGCWVEAETSSCSLGRSERRIKLHFNNFVQKNWCPPRKTRPLFWAPPC